VDDGLDWVGVGNDDESNDRRVFFECISLIFSSSSSFSSLKNLHLTFQLLMTQRLPILSLPPVCQPHIKATFACHWYSRHTHDGSTSACCWCCGIKTCVVRWRGDHKFVSTSSSGDRVVRRILWTLCVDNVTRCNHYTTNASSTTTRWDQQRRRMLSFWLCYCEYFSWVNWLQ
jgi:hypothetical protein